MDEAGEDGPASDADEEKADERGKEGGKGEGKRDQSCACEHDEKPDAHHAFVACLSREKAAQKPPCRDADVKEGGKEGSRLAVQRIHFGIEGARPDDGQLFDGEVEEPRKEEAQCAFEAERLLRRQGDLLFLRAVLLGGLLPKGEGEEHDEREHELHDGDRKISAPPAVLAREAEAHHIGADGGADAPAAVQPVHVRNKKACHVGSAPCA